MAERKKPDNRYVSRVMDILNELGSKNEGLYKLLDDPGWVGGVERGLIDQNHPVSLDGYTEIWRMGYLAGTTMREALKDTEWTHEEIRARIFNSPTVKQSDEVNHPNHYTSGSIEVWDFIVDQDLDYLRGNVIKYVSRAGKKDASKELQDLEKAQAYLNKAIEGLKKGVTGVVTQGVTPGS